MSEEKRDAVLSDPVKFAHDQLAYDEKLRPLINAASDAWVSELRDFVEHGPQRVVLIRSRRCWPGGGS